MSENVTELKPIDVVRALRGRGIDNPEELIQLCRNHHPDERSTLEAIRATCEWWDRKDGVGPRLLAKKIREGGIEPESRPDPGGVQARQRATHAAYAKRFPVGSVAEPHRRLQERRRYDDEPCPGSMIVLSHDYPSWLLECDRCGFAAALPLSAMAAVLPRRLEVVA